VLRVEFDDGTIQTIDLEPVLTGTLYGPLRDPVIFRQVRIDPEVHTSRLVSAIEYVRRDSGDSNARQVSGSLAAPPQTATSLYSHS